MKNQKYENSPTHKHTICDNNNVYQSS
jgi:hypothetical protein